MTRGLKDPWAKLHLSAEKNHLTSVTDVRDGCIGCGVLDWRSVVFGQ